MVTENLSKTLISEDRFNCGIIKAFALMVEGKIKLIKKTSII